jgi:hypothetical protein
MATVANVATAFDADGVLHGAGEAARGGGYSTTLPP